MRILRGEHMDDVSHTSNVYISYRYSGFPRTISVGLASASPNDTIKIRVETLSSILYIQINYTNL